MPLDLSTLMGQGPNILQAFLDRMMKEEQDRQAGLRGAAEQAYGTYTGATAAPMPQPDLMGEGIQQLFGDVGSIIAQKPEFAARSREDIMAKRAMMLQQRGENLQILRDKYITAAAQVGKMDPIKEMQYREKADRLSKLLDQQGELELQGVKETGAGERAQLAAKTDIEVANINSQAELMRWLASGAGQNEKGTMTPEKRTERLTNITKEFIDPKSKGVIKESIPLYLASILAVPPAVGQTEDKWTAEVVEHILGATKRKTMDAHQQELFKRSRLIHFPPSPPKIKEAAVDISASPIAGAEAMAELNIPRVILEAPTGTIPRGKPQELVNELRFILPKTVGARGPSELVIQRRAALRVQKIIEELRKRGIRVNFTNPIPGVIAEEYSDSFLNKEAEE